MTKARAPKIENRLAKVLVNDGGRTAAEAATRANERLAEIRTRLDKVMGKEIDRILTYSRARQGIDQAAAADINSAAVAIAEIAGAADRPDLSEVARGVLAMLDDYDTKGFWHGQAMAVHLDVLSLLRGGEASAEEVGLMMRRMEDMRRAIGAQENIAQDALLSDAS